MTNLEIICAWMEVSPTDTAGCQIRYEGNQDGIGSEHFVSPLRWWVADIETKEWEPRELYLDALWDVEERLRMELTPQWVTYVRSYGGDTELALHATPFQRIRALAAVLRPIVEPNSHTP